MRQYAPIIVFAYNRPDLLEQTLASIAQNAEAVESDLYVFADGPKASASAEVIERIKQVSEVVQSKKWCKTVTLYASEKNKGLANSVIGGVTQIVNAHGKVIIIEDDVTVSPYFLTFMNDALTLYENDEKVSSIGSWNYFCPPSVSGDNFFLRHPDSIAWATFKRAWAKFNPNTPYLQKEIAERGLGKYLNMENTVNLVKMLQKQEQGLVDSWAVRWTASVVLEDMLTFYPQYSIARHEGYAEGTHFSGVESNYDTDVQLAQKPIAVNRIPIIENKNAVNEYVKFYKKKHGNMTRLWTAFKRLISNKKKSIGA
jgi:GR25 family glycosyltransferase involved in LPS biosynthesis